MNIKRQLTISLFAIFALFMASSSFAQDAAIPEQMPVPTLAQEAIYSRYGFDFVFALIDSATASETDSRITLANAEPTKVIRMDSSFPHNARRVAGGYMLGSMPTPENIEVLANNGIKFIFSLTYAVNNTKKIKAQCAKVGIEHLAIRVGRRFPKVSNFIDTIKQYKPEEIYIHCDHGGDRSGAMLAFLLIKFHGWDKAEAMLSVLNHGKSDLNGLKSVLNELKIPYTQKQIDEYFSIYATQGGGLKGRNDDYKLLIRTTLEAAISSTEE